MITSICHTRGWQAAQQASTWPNGDGRQEQTSIPAAGSTVIAVHVIWLLLPGVFCFLSVPFIFSRFFRLFLIAYTPSLASSPDLVTRDAIQRATPVQTHINAHSPRRTTSTERSNTHSRPHKLFPEQTRKAPGCGRNCCVQNNYCINFCFRSVIRGLEAKASKIDLHSRAPPFPRVGLRDSVYHTNGLG